jgi:hypothetical protein
MRAPIAIAVAVIAIATVGCASNVVISDQFGDRIPKRVAVLPFSSSNVGKLAPAVIARDICYRHLAPRRFEDVELFDVDARLEAAGITTRDQLQQTSPQNLGAILECDAIVEGSVNEYLHVWGLVFDYSSVEVRVWMKSTQSGEILWTATSWAYSLSMGVDPFSVSVSAYRGVHWYEQLVLRFNESFQAIWDEIPGQ